MTVFYEDAANAYFKAAELIVAKKIQYMYATNRYEKSAECYSQLKSPKTFMCYKKIIEVYLKKVYLHFYQRNIGKAIQACFEYGYECQLKFGDTKKRDEFYKIGDGLRSKHKITHSCAIKKFERCKYGKDSNLAVMDLVKVLIYVK
ncbi:hypothetical protein RF11_04902 [Thelohanellus kitauei]|uniref:Alpha-soluble NSF attachment protein n=1 Tax=Thelohanellus kitauei TaxID=669202 RepID=A0A0C2M8I7_THEKT|nr:hypothetical protein RF11_04902 [Thelohanellus kitauei]